MANFWVTLSTFLPQLSSIRQMFHTQLKPPEQLGYYFTSELDGATNPHPLFCLFIPPGLGFSSHLWKLQDFSTRSSCLPAV